MNSGHNYYISSIAFKSDVGKKRKANEDCIATFRAMKAQEAPEFCQLLAVADGMGGHSKGEVASSMATSELFSEIVKKWSEPHLDVDDESLTKIVKDAYYLINTITYDKSLDEKYKGMGTTLVTYTNFATETESYHMVGNVGDSRCYIMDDNTITQISKDDSEVQIMIDNNEISKEEARSHPLRNRITNAIGAFPPEEFTSSVKVIDLSKYVNINSKAIYIILCSDGLHGLLYDREIYNEIKKGTSGKNAVNKLVKIANERGGPDNISIIIAKLKHGRLK